MRKSCCEARDRHETRDISFEKILEAIRTGGERLGKQVELIRRIFKREFSKHSDYKQAKKAIAALRNNSRPSCRRHIPKPRRTRPRKTGSPFGLVSSRFGFVRPEAG
jgi:hypothetical protein